MHVGGQANARAVLLLMAKRFLQQGEEAAGAREGDGHGTQFTKEFMPMADGNLFLSWKDGGKEFVQTVHAVGGQGDGTGHRVNQPAKHDLRGAPCPISFSKFLEGGRLLTGWSVRGFKGAKHLVERVEERAFNSKPPGWSALHQTKEIIHIDVPGPKGAPVVGRRR